MCFTVHEEHREAKTAKEDIKCWKVVTPANINGMCYSLHKNHPHHYGVLQTASFGFKLNRYRVITIEHGFHSFVQELRASVTASIISSWFVVECTIPKGAQYYYNPNEMVYVSNELIVHEPLVKPSLISRIKNYFNI
jgi:hypothetical protein